MAVKRKMGWMGWTVLAIVLVAGLLFAALQYSIGQNGPKVLDVVDRLSGGTRDVTLVHNQSLGTAKAQKLAVYQPAISALNQDARLPVFVFVHGGGWRSGDPDDYGFVARGLAPEGFIVVLAGYRLGAEGVFPAMLEDTAKAIAWTKGNIARFGGDPDAIIIAGHSAGAYNVAMMGLDPAWLGNEGMKPADLAGVIGLSGPYDFYPFATESTKLAFGGAQNPETTQPIEFARAGAPPMLLVQGDKDTVVKPRNARVLAAAVKKAGGAVTRATFTEMDHNGPILALASPWRKDRDMINLIDKFAREVLTKKTAAKVASVPVQANTP
ncbi:carboxylesterase family protein [Altererythrobacter confluentis]|uniref:Carboxylesterase family protein n=1 Tax=Allopontixanthobacter confluentis TaxID=1849021 RepID=A0A6L7GI99_9SPHN|nr:alpha/beta hydrolase [Allopontixanthobacter confluentis]MXP15290.1 carboxylesterase family protein [Allopontixanthobacter confluentis]